MCESVLVLVAAANFHEAGCRTFCALTSAKTLGSGQEIRPDPSVVVNGDDLAKVDGNGRDEDEVNVILASTHAQNSTCPSQ
jgi:hypothetical protein